MTNQDRSEFQDYLQACTDDQVWGVYEKERAAGRYDYAELAHAELVRRRLE
jgi:predicted Ser/Thr protein kinase